MTNSSCYVVVLEHGRGKDHGLDCSVVVLGHGRGKDHGLDCSIATTVTMFIKNQTTRLALLR